MKVYSKIIIIVVALLFTNTFGKRGVLVTIPSQVQSGATENICLTIHNVAEQMNFTVKLLLESGWIHSEQFHTPGVASSTGKAVCLSMEIPSNVSQDTRAKLIVEGATKYASYNFSVRSNEDVLIQKNRYITFIETDKPQYKPGQTVRFRILTIDSLLKPRIGLVSEVIMKNPKGVRVRQWKDIQDDTGLVGLEMRLSQEPILGDWSIQSIIDGQKTNVKFTVKKYVLPKFEVTVKGVNAIVISEKKIEGTVCAKYMYGQPVQGTVDLTACVKPSYNQKRPCKHMSLDINGCISYAFNSSDIYLQAKRFALWSAKLHIVARVTETATRVTLEGTKSIKLVREIFHLRIDSLLFFKPSLDYFGKVIVRTPNGHRYPGRMVTVAATDVMKDIYFRQYFWSDASGEVKFALDTRPFAESKSITIIASAMMKPEWKHDEHEIYSPHTSIYVRPWYSPSRSYITISPPQSVTPCDGSVIIDIQYVVNGSEAKKTSHKFYYQAVSRGNIVVTGSKRVTYSPQMQTQEKSGTYLRPDTPPTTVESTSSPTPGIQPIQVEPLVTSFDVKENVINPIKEVASLDDDKQTGAGPIKKRQIERGKSVHSAATKSTVSRTDNRVLVEPQFVANAKIEIPVTNEMSPKTQVVVYIVRDDGEIVSDSVAFDVQFCFSNKVNLSSDRDTYEPGSSATLVLTAHRQSLCGVAMIDRSAETMVSGTRNRLTPSAILKALHRPDVHDDIRYDNQYCLKKLRLDEPQTPPDVPFLTPPEFEPPPVEHERPQVEHKKPPVEHERPPVEHERPPGEHERPPVEHEPRAHIHTSARHKRNVPLRYTSYHVDSSQAFSTVSLRTATDLTLDTRPCFEWHVGLDRGGPMPIVAEGGKDDNGGDSQSDSNILRSYFPETWLWSLHHVTDTNVTIRQAIPDSITEWVGSAVCIHPDAGVGLSPTVSVTAFKPFFVSLTLPYKAIRGENLPIVATVFNFLNECLAIRIKFHSSQYFDITGSSWKLVCVCGHKTASHTFYITLKSVGHIDVTASAIVKKYHRGTCPVFANMDTAHLGMNDGVKRKLIVEAEGHPQTYTHSSLLCTWAEKRASFSLKLPSNAVPGSERAYITAIGDVMGPRLTNLDSIVRLPTGCGEQNMVRFTPNIFVMQYLRSTNLMTTATEAKLKDYLRIGYQRQQLYRHADGSYSAFGSADKTGNTWLTAFVVKSFAQARSLIDIDEQSLEMSINWFFKHQGPDGCFASVGRVLHSAMKGGVGRNGSPATLAAYVLVALLEAGLPRDHMGVLGAIDCIEADDLRDTYSISLAAYAMSLYNKTDELTIEYARRLVALANTTGGYHWSRSIADSPHRGKTQWIQPTNGAASADVEMTAYALMTHIIHSKPDKISEMLPIVQWLSKQRNPDGGFASTQDTVVALQALSMFASRLYIRRLHVNVRTRVNNQHLTTLHIVPSNRLVQQRTSIRDLPANVDFVALGNGCALVQANIRYNVKEEKIKKPVFHLTATAKRSKKDRNNCRRKTLHICVGFNWGEGLRTNMAVIEVKMATGWQPVESSLDTLINHSYLPLKRYEVHKGIVNLYFDEIDKQKKCLDFEIHQEILLSAPKATWVKIYDYYEAGLMSKILYRVRTICGTKDEIPFTKQQPMITPDIMQRRVGVNPPLPATTVASSCPRCLSDLSNDVNLCDAINIFKAKVRLHYSRPIRITADMRPRNKVTMRHDLVYRMSRYCECPQVIVEGKVLIIKMGGVTFNPSRPLQFDENVIIVKVIKGLLRHVRELVLEKCG